MDFPGFISTYEAEETVELGPRAQAITHEGTFIVHKLLM